MIALIEALNYKCLRYIRQRLREFQILIGPNASGKSTFLDVFAFMKDVLEGGPEEAVLKRTHHLRELVWQRQGDWFEMALELVIPEHLLRRLLTKERYSVCRYEIRVGIGQQGNIQLLREAVLLKPALNAGEKEQTRPSPEEPPSEITIELRRGKRVPSGWRGVIVRVPEGNVYFRSEVTGWNAPFRIDPRRSAFANLPEDNERFPIALWARRFLLSGVHVLMLNSQRMKEPCRPDAPKTLQPDGSNLPIVIRELRKHHENQFRRWLSHVQMALPQVKDINVREREIDRFLFLEIHLEQGLRLPAWMLSDGTLRFLALTLLAYLPNPDTVYLIEEPENGIHPKALELVFQSLSSVYNGQVFIATHSPLILALAEPKNLLCFTLSDSGATTIIEGDKHPHLREWRRDISLADLFAAGVLG
jgi:predicted ATPase